MGRGRRRAARNRLLRGVPNSFEEAVAIGVGRDGVDVTVLVAVDAHEVHAAVEVAVEHDLAGDAVAILVDDNLVRLAIAVPVVCGHHGMHGVLVHVFDVHAHRAQVVRARTVAHAEASFRVGWPGPPYGQPTRAQRSMVACRLVRGRVPSTVDRSSPPGAVPDRAEPSYRGSPDRAAPWDTVPRVELACWRSCWRPPGWPGSLPPMASGAFPTERRWYRCWAMSTPTAIAAWTASASTMSATVPVPARMRCRRTGAAGAPNRSAVRTLASRAGARRPHGVRRHRTNVGDHERSAHTRVLLQGVPRVRYRDHPHTRRGSRPYPVGRVLHRHAPSRVYPQPF